VATRPALALAALLALPALAAAATPSLAHPRALGLHDPRASAGARALVRAAPPETRYGELTHDGRPEVLVTVRSGPADGVVAYFVYSVDDGRVRDLFPVNEVFRARVDLRAHRLVERLPVYRGLDRVCCPSLVQTTVYRWDGTGFAIQARSRTRSPVRGF
jgi:hypothetical protein